MPLEHPERLSIMVDGCISSRLEGPKVAAARELGSRANGDSPTQACCTFPTAYSFLAKLS